MKRPTTEAAPFALRLRVGGEELVLYAFGAPASGPLTEAELAVAAALVVGATAQEIADARSTSRHTVVKQIASVYRKLDVRTQAALVKLCRFVA